MLLTWLSALRKQLAQASTRRRTHKRRIKNLNQQAEMLEDRTLLTDLSAMIVDGLDPIVTGQNSHYTVTIENTDGGDVTGATLDTIVSFPAGTFTVSGESLSFSGSGSATLVIEADGPNVTDLNLPSGETATLTFLVTPNTGIGTITTTATVAGGTPVDPNNANDTAVETTAVNSPDLSVIYVNDDFTMANGFNDGDTIQDADPNTAGDQTAVVGVTAFASITDGVDAVDDGGSVLITDDLAGDAAEDATSPDAAIVDEGPTTYNENLNLLKSVTIQATEGDAAAVTVDGSAADSVFIVQPGRVVTLDSLTIENGLAANGGGISIGGTLNLNNSLVQNNSATVDGGGIFNTATLNVNGSTIQNNNADNNGGGIFNSGAGTATIDNASAVSGNAAGSNGGGIFTSGTITIQNGSRIDENTASSEGGGVWNSATLIVDGSTIGGITTGNTAGGDGGGIFNQGTATIQAGSTITGNSAALGGGGVLNDTAGSLIVDGSTIDSNTASNEGGGIFNVGMLTLDGSTIGGINAGNSASSNGGGIFNEGTATIQDGSMITGNSAAIDAGGIFNTAGASLTVSASTVSMNTASDDGGGIENDGTAMILNGSQITGNSASDNGGGIFNGLGEVTVDASTVSTNSASSGAGIWNTGTATINGGTVTGNTAADEGGGVWSRIGTVTITDVAIDGNTARGDAANQGGGGVFNDGGMVNITGGSISSNAADGAAGSGGGILNDGGTLTIDGTIIDGNSAVRAGGGIEATTANNRDSNVVLTDVTISDNVVGSSPGNGGGVHITDPAGGNVSTFTMTGGFVTGNSAAAEGGGLWNDAGGTMTLIDNVLVDGNTAAGNVDPTGDPATVQGGGGIFNNGGILVLTGTVGNAPIVSNNEATGATNGSGGGILSTGGVVNAFLASIAGNTANRAGGGVEVSGGIFRFFNSTVDGNNAGLSPGNGGGVHITGTASVEITESTVSNNTANEGGGLWNSGSGTYTVVNSTISTNTATGSDGGGVFNTDGGTVDLHSVTITLNSANTAAAGGGGIAGGNGGVTIQNTIVAQNVTAVGEENLSGTIQSDDHNLIGDADDGNLVGDTDETIFGANALLAPLADNGGPTLTHLPLAGSPAIGNGNSLDPDNVSKLTTDQRNVSRPQGSQDDIGAVEVDLNGFVVSANDLAAGTAGDGNPDEFLVTMDDQGTSDPSDDEVVVFVNSTQVFREPAGTTGLIVIRGSADDDMLITDNSNGLITANLIFDGDGVGSPGGVISPGGFDRLVLRGSTPTTTTYNPGSTPDQGAVYQENDANVQRVQFFGLEPVQVVGSGAGDTLVVGDQVLGVGFPQALNADNTINYTEGPNSDEPFDLVFAGDTTGLVTVDGFESLEFSNFGSLEINAGAGSDTINLNNPTAPTALTNISVNGGDPTAEIDVVIVNGAAGVDSVTVDQFTDDGARVDGAQGVPVIVDETERLIYEGQGGDDDLTVRTPDLVDFIELTVGDVVSPDLGVIRIYDFADSLFPIFEFSGLGFAGSLTFEDATGGREDDLFVNGTGVSERFTLTSDGELQVRTFDGFPHTVPILTPGISNLVLRGHGGDDIFDIPGDFPFQFGVTIDGGNPSSGSDELNFVGSGGAVTLDLDAQTITETGFAPVVYNGIENINIDANAALTVVGTADNDVVDVTPLAAGDGRFTHNLSSGLNFAYTDAVNIGFTGGTGGVDSLNILGDDGSDVATVTTTNVIVDGSIVEYDGSIEALGLFTAGGDDQVTIDVDGTGLIAPPITFDGGTGSDALIVTGTPTTTIDEVIYSPGPDNAAGRLDYISNNEPVMIIDFVNLEPVVDLVTASTLTVNGTNADNAISYTEGSVAANGLVSVDGFETIEFSNKTNLVINALAGSDTINLNNPTTPTDLTGITVNGGDPTADTDTVIVNGTEGQEDITVAPTGIDAATITGLNAQINLSTVEHLTIEGQGGDDALTYTSPADGAEIVLTPESVPDAGSITANGFSSSAILSVSFANLGLGGNLTFANAGGGRIDGLDIVGTDNDDQFSVSAAGVVQIVKPAFLLPVTLPINTPGVTFMRLIGRDGGDFFNIAGNHPLTTGIEVQGGNPSSGSDVLNFTGSGAGAVTIDLQTQTVTETGFSPVFYSGIEIISVNAAGQDVSFDGTTGNDQITATPTGSNAVNVTVAGINTVFQISNIGEFDVDGMGGDNVLTVNGTSAGDFIFVTGTNVEVFGLEDVDFANIGALNIDAKAGQDNILVDPGAVPVFVNGGNPIGELQQPVGDVLNVITGGAAFTFLPGPEPDSGTFAVAGSAPVSFDEIELLQVNDNNYILPDRFDDTDLVLVPNDSIATATNLGSERTVIEQRLTLHDEGAGVIDEDFFKITAHDTGKLIFNVFFSNAAGNVDIEVLDMSGDVIATATSTDDDEQIIVPVVSQEMYFLRVFSADGVPNIYNLEVENFAAPVPDRIHLDPADDLGMMGNDNVTSEAQPRFLIQADLQDFADMGIDILTADQALANLADPDANPFPGAAVEVHIISATTGLVHDAPVGAAEMLNISGFADAIGVSNILFEFEPTNPLADDTYFVTTAVRIFDGQIDPDANGRTRLSEPLWFTIDASAPKGMVLESFRADLTGAQENPPVTTLAGGDALLRVNPAGDRVEVVIELAGLDLDGNQTPALMADNVTNLHIHMAPVGVNGSVIFGLIGPNHDPEVIVDPVSGRITAGWDIHTEGSAAWLAMTNEERLTALRTQQLYVNVHTVANPTGEVRGQILSAGGAIQLLESSDTGMSVIDGVTNIQSPAFVVKGEAGAKVRIFARNTLTGTVNQVGNGQIGSDSTDGVVGNGFGLAEITVEPMGDGSYEFFAEFEDLAGNVSRHFDFTPIALPVDLVDNDTTTIPVNVAGLFGNITDLDLRLDLTHADLSELTIQLTSPDGTTITLANAGDLAGVNLVNTTLDDEAATAITAGTATYSGRFVPEELLSAFDGENPNGTWMLTIVDDNAGNVGILDDFHLCIATNGGLPVEIDTREPNTAQLNVIAESDTGRNDEDNVTFDNTPNVTLTTTDPNSQFHTLFTDNLTFRLFDRYEGAEEFLLYDSARDGEVDAVSTIGDMFTSLQLILETLPEQYFTLIGTNDAVIDLMGSGVLADGVHELKLEVEDRAGNISHDFLLTLVVDTAAPPVSFGLSTVEGDGLTPDSDSGKATSPGTLTDNITNVTNPTFWGRAEADSIVRIFLDVNGDGLVDDDDIFLGQDTAIPIDGNDAEPDGYWEIASVVGLNDQQVIDALGLDGLRQILVTAEDQAGNVNAPGDGIGNGDGVVEIFLDTQGPRIVDPDGIGPQQAIQIGGAPGFNLFAPVLGQGPTPPITSLIINIEDAPDRIAQFLYGALDEGIASNRGRYLLVGDHNGIISIDDVIVTNLPPVAGEAARATIELRFNTPLPDDRYSFTIQDDIVDPACNKLDGESNFPTPAENFLVRTGDGNPGGDFFGRFTVDSRPEIASVGQGVALVDFNGNLVLDLNAVDFTNRDGAIAFGLPTDALFAGQFTPPGVPSDGFDRFGAYGLVGGAYRWLLDFNNDSVPDFNQAGILQINGLPFAGEFVAGQTGDEVGLFDGSTWYIDTNGDNNIGPSDLRIPSNMRGLPIVGDFDGDGLTDLATHLASANAFFFDLTGADDGTPGVLDGNTDAQIDFGFGGVLERPFAADFNLDGVTDIGLTVPNRNDLDADVSDWYFLISNPAAHTPGTLNALFNAVPGEETQFGSNEAVPVVGNFRPPAPQFANIRPGAGVVGADAGGGPHVRVFDSQTGEERLSFFAYDPRFTGGVRVASGDVNGDGVADVITGPGAGGGPHIRVFDGTDGLELASFMAFDPGFFGGVFVASGDVDGDLKADIIVSAGPGGGPHVRVFSGADFTTELASFMAFDPGFRGGVSVAAGDTDNDGFADIIVGAGAGGGPHVRVISGADGTTELLSFFAYAAGFTGGVSVAAGDIDGDNRADIITGAGPGGGPHVRVFSGVDGSELLNFFAFAPGFTGGIRVAAGDIGLDNQMDILATTGPGVSPIVRAVTRDANGIAVELGNFSAFGLGFTGGAFVAGQPMPGETLLLGGGTFAAVNDAGTLSQADLDATVEAASSRLNIRGDLPTFRITDLAGQQLGRFLGNTILIDADAAGRGWFVDTTPDADEEFDGDGNAVSADALGRVDLLTVVLHELGHSLGLAHSDDANSLMAATLRPGHRKLLKVDEVDDLFVDGSLFESLDGE